MTQRIAGSSGKILEVGEKFGAAHVRGSPVDYGANGSYQVCVTSGIIAAALAAGGVLFAMRWTHATKLMVLHKLKWRFQTLTLFTAAQQVDFGLDALVARDYPNVHTGGTALTLTTHSMKKRKNMATTSMGDIRIATTAALGGAASLSLDPHPFVSTLGDGQRMNPAAATEEQKPGDLTGDWWPDVASGEMPLVFGVNEGIVIRNRTVWPAAGTGLLQVEAAWSEVDSY